MRRALRAWWLWRRRLKELERDEAAAYWTWRRASVIARATSVVYADKVSDGTWWRETDKAQAAVTEAYERFAEVRNQLRDHKDMQ